VTNWTRNGIRLVLNGMYKDRFDQLIMGAKEER